MQQHKNFTLCLDTRQPGGVFRKLVLDTRQSEIIIEFSRNNLSLRIAELCLEMPSDFRYYFVVEEIFELGQSRFLTFCPQFNEKNVLSEMPSNSK